MSEVCIGGGVGDFAGDPREIEAVRVGPVEDVCSCRRGEGRVAWGRIGPGFVVLVVDGRMG